MGRRRAEVSRALSLLARDLGSRPKPAQKLCDPEQAPTPLGVCFSWCEVRTKPFLLVGRERVQGPSLGGSGTAHSRCSGLSELRHPELLQRPGQGHHRLSQAGGLGPHGMATGTQPSLGGHLGLGRALTSPRCAAGASSSPLVTACPLATEGTRDTVRAGRPGFGRKDVPRPDLPGPVLSPAFEASWVARLGLMCLSLNPSRGHSHLQGDGVRRRGLGGGDQVTAP